MSRIIVKKLPKDLKEQQLKDHFAAIGTVTECSLKYNDRGFRGFAFVGFYEKDGAISAVKCLNHSRLGTASAIEVQVAEASKEPSGSSGPSKKQKKGIKAKFRDVKQNANETVTEEMIETFDPDAENLFDEYPISSETKKGLHEAHYVNPTKIQKLSIRLALLGKNITGSAKTGSGKTLAFVIPVLERLHSLKWSRTDGLGALIVTPTRELAVQIFEVLKRVGKYHKMNCGLIVGGTDRNAVVREEQSILSSNIIVCTPGRMLHHIDQAAYFNLDNLQVLVLDEADRILEEGFQETINAILEAMPADRQTLIFSATQTRNLNYAGRLRMKSSVYVSADERAAHSTPDTLEQAYVVCELHEKLNLLWSFIKRHLRKKVLVFFATCKQVRFVHNAFCKLRPGIPLLALHSRMKQKKRIEMYDSFSRKQFAIMFATNVAARGLDFSSINWVIQMDCPSDGVNYIHRVGRTARNAQKGKSLLVLLPTEEEAMLKELEMKRVKIERIRLNPKEMQTVTSRLQTLCVQDIEMKEFAKRAFVTYIKDVDHMKNKQIFSVKNLKLEEFSKSLGLITIPRLRFLERREKTQSKKSAESERPLSKDQAVDNGDDSSSSSLSSGEQTDVEEERMKKMEKQPLTIEGAESDTDDLFVAKRTLPPLEASEMETVPAMSKKKLKPISKIAEKKKMLKKCQLKRIVFSEDDENKTTAAAENEDDYAVMFEPLDNAADKKRYKERMTQLKQEKKLKRKRQLKAEKEKMGMQLKMRSNGESDNLDDSYNDEDDQEISENDEEDDEHDDDQNNKRRKKIKLQSEDDSKKESWSWIM